MKIYIYALTCPTSGELRYVGKSQNPQKRLSAHINGALKHAYDHHTARWIRKLASEGLRPSWQVLQEIPGGAGWREAERMWIAYGRHSGWPLTNSTAGGEGLDYLNPEDEKKYRENLARSMAAYNQTPKGRAQFLRFRAAAGSEETRIKRATSVRASARRPEYREKMRAVNSEINSRPEVKAKKAAASRANFAGGGLERCVNSAEFKADQAERLKGRWKDPTAKKKMQDARWTDEQRAAQAAALDARREKMLAAMTPEVRARQGAKMKEWHARRRAERNQALSAKTPA